MTYQNFFDFAKEKGFRNIQITEEQKQENSIYLINAKVDDYTDSDKKNFIIKAEKDGKTEQVHSEYLDTTIIDLLLEKIATTESKYEDEYLKETNYNNRVEENINIDIEEETKILKSYDTIVANYPNIKSLETAYGDVYTKTRIINNHGVDISTSSHTYELYVEASIEKDDTISTYSESLLESDKKNIAFKKIINKVLHLATIGVNKRKLETKKYNVVLSNKVTAQIINNLIPMLSSTEIHQKKSCLANKLNQQVFSKKLTIVEEPQNKNYPGYTIFDKEGTPTINKEIISSGTIKTFLYDIKEAKIDKLSSTGNKYNGISTRNMYIIPTKKELETLFKEMKNGIYITSYMGSTGTSVNCSSGSISMQVFGYIIENGQIICAFEPAIMTTTIFELLSNIQSIGNDLKFSLQTVGAPSLYIKDISIAAE